MNNHNLIINFEDDTSFEFSDGDYLVGYGSYFEEDSFALVKIRHPHLDAFADVTISGTLKEIIAKLNSFYFALVDCCKV